MNNVLLGSVQYADNEIVKLKSELITKFGNLPTSTYELEGYFTGANAVNDYALGLLYEALGAEGKQAWSTLQAKYNRPTTGGGSNTKSKKMDIKKIIFGSAAVFGILYLIKKR